MGQLVNATMGEWVSKSMEDLGQDLISSGHGFLLTSNPESRNARLTMDPLIHSLID
jgi:hypothetical protein